MACGWFPPSFSTGLQRLSLDVFTDPYQGSSGCGIGRVKDIEETQQAIT